MTKTIFISLFIIATSVSAGFGQKRKTVASKPSKIGIYKTIKSGKDTINLVRLDPATKSVTVSGVTLDWEKDGTVYFMIELRKGQHLIITPDPDDISISTYTKFAPLDATTSGVYDLEALETTSYSISAASENPGKKYTLVLQLKND